MCALLGTRDYLKEVVPEWTRAGRQPCFVHEGLLDVMASKGVIRWKLPSFSRCLNSLKNMGGENAKLVNSTLRALNAYLKPLSDLYKRKQNFMDFNTNANGFNGILQLVTIVSSVSNVAYSVHCSSVHCSCRHAQNGDNNSVNLSAELNWVKQEDEYAASIEPDMSEDQFERWRPTKIKDVQLPELDTSTLGVHTLDADHLFGGVETHAWKAQIREVGLSILNFMEKNKHILLEKATKVCCARPPNSPTFCDPESPS